MKLKTSSVRWVNIPRPGNLIRIPKTAQCPTCHKIFSCNQNLIRHKKTAHPDNTTGTIRAWDPSHTCTQCTQTHPNKGKLDDHIASVHGCPECNYHCATGGTLANHQISIHGSIPCHGCSLRFDTKLALRQHHRSNCGGSRS